MANTLDEALNIASEDNVIIPGTTPRLNITIDDALMDNTVETRIDILQDNKVILQIMENEIVGHVITHTFTQAETYTMTPGKILQVQVHGRTNEDLAWKSQVLTLTVGDSLTKTSI